MVTLGLPADLHEAINTSLLLNNLRSFKDFLILDFLKIRLALLGLPYIIMCHVHSDGRGGGWAVDEEGTECIEYEFL